MIGNIQLDNKELISRIYKTSSLAILIKVMTNLMVSYWFAVFGIIENNADAILYGKVVKSSNFLNGVLVPLLVIYLIRLICELVYRLTIRLEKNENNTI